MIPIRQLIGTVDLLFVTLESLRYDAATAARTPSLSAWLPEWEPRHSPGNFTYAAHHAFFSGFLPTPARPGRHPRLFASRFGGSKSIHPQTWVFEQACLPEALAAKGYRTVCIGGTGFFNGRNALGSVLPAMFQQSYWQPAMGVNRRESAKAQVAQALEVLDETPQHQRLFLFLNLSATHAPTHIYHPELDYDCLETQIAAFEQAAPELARLLSASARRAPTLAIVCADHGEAFGEDGLHGHRLGHESVWTVPYAEALIGGATCPL